MLLRASLGTMLLKNYCKPVKPQLFSTEHSLSNWKATANEYEEDCNHSAQDLSTVCTWTQNWLHYPCRLHFILTRTTRPRELQEFQKVSIYSVQLISMHTDTHRHLHLHIKCFTLQRYPPKYYKHGVRSHLGPKKQCFSKDQSLLSNFWLKQMTA